MVPVDNDDDDDDDDDDNDEMKVRVQPSVVTCLEDGRWGDANQHTLVDV